MANNNNSTNITFTTASPGSTTNTSTNTTNVTVASSPSQEPTSSSSLPTTPSVVSSSRVAGAASTSCEEKILSRFTSILLADGSRKKIEVADHFKRLAYLRKEADQLEKTDWQYEGVEKLLGK